MLNELENLGLRPRRFRIPQRNPTVSAGADVTPLETRTGRPRERSARYCNPRDEASPDAKSRPLSLALGNATGCLVSDERQRDHVPAIVPERQRCRLAADFRFDRIACKEPAS
jgi:hypothetical protein